MHTMMFSTCPNECAQIWSYAPKSCKKMKKNDDDDDDKEDVEGLEVNYVYVGIVCVLYILLVWATTLGVGFGVYGVHWHCTTVY